MRDIETSTIESVPGAPRVLRTNDDAFICTVDHIDYTNRSGALHGRNVSLPKGTVVLMHDADGNHTHDYDAAASIQLQRRSGDESLPVGSLPGHYVEALLHFLRNGTGSTDRTVFVSWSYETPIKWSEFNNGSSVMPPVRYSLTTNGHQSAVNGTHQFFGSESARKGKGQSPYGPGWQTRRRFE